MKFRIFGTGLVLLVITVIFVVSGGGNESVTTPASLGLTIGN